MGIWKRAYLYVIRKKVRSMLLFLIFLAAGLFLFTGISIRQSAREEAENFRKTLTTGLRVESVGTVPYEEAFDENGEKFIDYKASLIREHHIKEFLAIEGVSGFYCDNLQSNEAYTGLTLHPGFYSWCLDIANGAVSPKEANVTQEEVEYMVNEKKHSKINAQSNRFLKVYDSEWHPSFINGAVELVEGRHVKVGEERKVVISDEVAGKNGLKVGDTITAQLSDCFTGELYGKVYTTEIVGIFHINFEQRILHRTCEDDILANTFFSTPDIWTFFRREYQIEYGYPVFAPIPDDIVCLMTIFVEDPALLDEVKEKLLALDSIDWKYYEFGIYDTDYRTAAAPLLSMMKISGALTVISAVGVLVILYLVLLIWMRSRKHEFGIFISIGMKKKALRQQLLVECCSIAALAFLAALLLSGPVTKLAGNGLETILYASGETEKFEVEIEMNTDDMYINMLPPAKGDALPYAVTLKDAGFVVLLLIGTAAAAVLASSAELLGQKPGEIRL